MNWFERHLNWSLVLGAYLFPNLVSLILGLIFLPQFFTGFSTLMTSGAGESEIMAYMLGTFMQFAVVFFVAGLILLIFACTITWWYLGRKARNKWLLLLLFVPFPIGFIILLVLDNKAISHGGDSARESVANRWPDNLPFVEPDDRQLKELDYTPNKNVLDIVDKPDIKDAGANKDVTGVDDAGAASIAGEETAAKKAVERSVSAERLKLPILLDDSGAAISCFYHPGADAVNMCSRCHKYVCAECNYITGTHPICHNCWDKRAAIPIAPPAQKQVKPAPVKPQKQKVVKPAPPEPIEVVPTRPQEPVGLEPVRPAEPITAEPVKPPEPEYVIPVKPEPQKVVASAKADKQEAEKSEWQQEFMALYEQASPIINVVTSKSADGMPASPLDLMEGLKLRPMLERIKKLSKPKDKELREAKSEFEQVLSSCIKIADAAADFVSGGGQALLGGPDFTRIVRGIETASELMQKLSSKLASFTSPQE